MADDTPISYQAAVIGTPVLSTSGPPRGTMPWRVPATPLLAQPAMSVNPVLF
jgi:hypothetical protein